MWIIFALVAAPAVACLIVWMREDSDEPDDTVCERWEDGIHSTVWPPN